MERIYIKNGSYTILGFAEEKYEGEMTIYNDYFEMFGIRNEMEKPLYFRSFMIPGYSGLQENKGIDIPW